MKTGKYYFVLGIIVGILCVPVFGEVELPERVDKPLLPDRHILTGVEKLQIVIVPGDSEPNKDGLIWKELGAKVERKIVEAGIKAASETIVNGGEFKKPQIAELRINIDMLKLADLQQYVFRVQTSLAKKVYLTKNYSRSTKADVWNTKAAMRAVPVKDMPAEVTSLVLEQAEAFIGAWLAANPEGIQTAEPNDIGLNCPKLVEPVTKQTAGSGQYVTSINSKVFHKAECSSAKRIKGENRENYSSRSEAVKAGKRPCKLCNP